MNNDCLTQQSQFIIKAHKGTIIDKFEEEMAKAAGQIVVDTAKDGRAAIFSFFGDAVGELGKTLGDEARLFRFKNLLRIGDKVQAIRDQRGLTPDQMKALPFGDSLRAVEASSMEDDDDVQVLWARLIANATAMPGEATMKKSYIDLLKALSGIEAVLLDLLWKFDKSEFQTKEELDAFNEALTEALDARWRRYPEADRKSAAQNLLRLRIISMRPKIIDGDGLLGKVPRQIMETSWQDWAFIDAKKFGPFIEQVIEQIATVTGAKEEVPTEGVPLQHQGWGFRMRPWMIDAPEMNYLLMSLGKDLMTACSPGASGRWQMPQQEDAELAREKKSSSTRKRKPAPKQQP